MNVHSRDGRHNHTLRRERYQVMQRMRPFTYRTDCRIYVATSIQSSSTPSYEVDRDLHAPVAPNTPIIATLSYLSKHSGQMHVFERSNIRTHPTAITRCAGVTPAPPGPLPFNPATVPFNPENVALRCAAVALKWAGRSRGISVSSAARPKRNSGRAMSTTPASEHTTMYAVSRADHDCKNTLLTASTHLSPSQAFAEEDCGGACRTERREEREDRRVREREVLQREVYAEKAEEPVRAIGESVFAIH